MAAATTAAAPPKPETGHPAHAHRTLLLGMLWRLRTGAPWRDLPERDGPWRTVARRVSRWPKAGRWQRLVDAVKPQAEAAGQSDGESHDVDRPLVRAHQPAAGANKGSQRRKREAAARAASVPRSTAGQRGMASGSP